MNLVILIGNLGEVPTVRKTQAGMSVTTFSLATTERWKDTTGVKQERTDWHKVQAWGGNADNCAAYLKKGSKIQVTGQSRKQPWTDEQGVKRNPTIVVMDKMEMLGDPGHQANTTAALPPNPPTPTPAQTNTPDPPAPPAQPVGPTYEQLIAHKWTPVQIATDSRFAHLKPATAAQEGFMPDTYDGV